MEEILLCFYWNMQECNAKANDSEVVGHETTWSLLFDLILNKPAELQNLKTKHYEENKKDIHERTQEDDGRKV